MMKLKQNLHVDTDKAWKSLHNRLEDDGLLNQRINSAQPKRSYIKKTIWVTSVAALVAGAVLLFTMHGSQTVHPKSVVLHNALGKPTLVTTLEDGSTIFLSEHTSIEYPTHFAHNKREIRLTGDAFFDIARKVNSPFIINTENILIEVLGTSFSVSSKTTDIFSLSVRSGQVRITAKSTGNSLLVTAGQTVLLQEDKLRTMANTDLDNFKSYLNKIYFKDQQLGNVLRIMNERNKDSIPIICLPEVAEREITVTLSNESPRDIARIICAGLNLTWHQKQNTLYITNHTE